MGRYKERWDAYRRMSVFTSLFLVVGLPFVVLACVLVRWRFDVELTLVFPLLLACWTVCWGYLAFRLIRFPCPRCGAPFLRNQSPVIQSKRACPNCGLGLYEDSDELRDHAQG